MGYVRMSNEQLSSGAKSGNPGSSPYGEVRELLLDHLSYPAGLFDERLIGEADDGLSGLIPPIVAPVSGDRWCVVDGCKRLAAYRTQGRTQAPCIIIAPSPGEYDLGVLRMRLNRWRTPAMREKVLFLRWLDRWRKNKPLARVAEAAGISAGECRRLEPLLKSREALIDAVVQGKIHPVCAQELVRWDARDQDAFMEALSGLEPSQQTQREIAEWLGELASAEERSISGLIEEIIVPVAAKPHLNAPQRIAKIHEAIFVRRFPRYSAARERWRKAAQSANPASSAIRFVPNPYFEKDRLEVRVRVRAPGEAVGLFRDLAAISAEQWRLLINPGGLGTQ
ncbi:MAG: hypothetical protein GF344_02335 [Chitinivibrionales bacterium]|nr:hypothetical protein [Chitinivibrionales bacterium]MBD3355930.1 hypothetical protein [Chitinivibrionales bacterium]